VSLPAFKIQPGGYSNALAFSITPASYRYGGGRNYGTATITGSNTSNAPVMNPQPITFQGRKIIGQKFTSSKTTIIGYSTTYVPYLYSSDGTFTGDFTFMMLGNPASGGAYTRLWHQGHADYGPSSNLTAMGNFSGATHGVVSGMITFFEYNGSIFQGYGDAANALDGNVHCWIFRRASGVHSIWRDGIDVTSAQSTNSASIGGNDPSLVYLIIGGASTTSEDQASNCNFALSCGWNRPLTNGEIVKLGNNPFLMFQDPDDIFLNFSTFSPPVGRFIGIDQAVNRAATF